MSASPDMKTCEDVHAKVGSFLFHWSLLEQALTGAIHDEERRRRWRRSRLKGNMDERLAKWLSLVGQDRANSEGLDTARLVRTQCLALRDIRNMIVHGLIAVDASREDAEPRIRCSPGGYRNPGSERVDYTLSELEDFVQAIDACRRAFINLDNFNFRLDRLGPVGTGHATA